MNDHKSMPELDHDAMWEIMKASDPLTLRSLVASNAEIWDMYQRNRSSLWRFIINRDFEKIYSLLRLSNAKWTSTDQNVSGDTYLACMRDAHAAMARYSAINADPQIPVSDLLRSIELFFKLNPTLLRKQRSRFYIPIATFTTEHQPSLLESIVQIIPSCFYKYTMLNQRGFADMNLPEGNTDYTLSILRVVKHFTGEQLKMTVPYILKLFFDPHPLNPTGFLNRDYSDPTKEMIQELGTKWYDMHLL